MQNCLRKKPRKPIRRPVTLIVGIICKDGIVVAADSQTTNLSTGMARTDGSKIYNITLSDGASGVIATAGGVDWSLQIIERIEQAAGQSTLRNARSFADLVEKANIEIKQKERLARRPAKELQQHFNENEASLLIANYFRGDPYMYTFNSNGLVSPTRVTKQLYTTIGNSESMADYILKKFDIPTTLAGVAHALALYTINEIITAKDTFCYYPIQVSHALPHPPDLDTGESTAMSFSAEEISEELKIVAIASRRIESELKRGMWASCLAFVEMMESRTVEMENEIKHLKQKLEVLNKN